MIRFCDKEVCCVFENEMDRQQLINYFLDGHRMETICVVDREGKFSGSIIYSMILGRELNRAISRECIVLGNTTWEEARRCFERYPVEFGGIPMIPVIDKERNLLCFAYQDDEANRELRMLDELKDYKSALDFKDIYSEYDSVTVHGCNELAFQFVMYLRKCGVTVNVTGELWDYLFLKDSLKEFEKLESSTLDYRNLEVYAEGTKSKERRVGLRPSVSSEFECVDKIYETNILEGIIHDAEGTLENLLQILRKSNVGILSSGIGTLNAYDLLLKYGVDICCFVSGTIDCENRKLFGKPVTGRMQAEVEWENLVLIDPDVKHSSWGFGQTDMCSYLGFKRNQQFFALQDYTEIPSHGFVNILEYCVEHLQSRIILAGDLWLCLKLKQILEENTELYGMIMYCDVLGGGYEGKYADEKKMSEVDVKELQSEDICLLLIPEYYGCYSSGEKDSFYIQKVLSEYKKKLKCKTENIIEYPFEDIKKYKISITKKVLDDQETKLKLIPAKIILGAMNDHSGNIFFRQILERHPDIIMIPYNYLSFNLFSICERLSMERGRKILRLFWKIYEEESLFLNKNFEKNIFYKKDIFEQSMLEFLDKKECFMSWELFVIIHISYAKMQGKKVEDISEITIYWEPHFVDISRKEAYTEWLGEIGSQCYLVYVVRNAIMRAGSALGTWDGRKVSEIAIVHMFPNSEKVKYPGWKRIVLKFENLKLNSEKELQLFCTKTGIRWTNRLLDNKLMYGDKNIFNKAPVYRTWEKYFSSFDRFRLSLIAGLWQKEYGYPFVSSLEFSRRELQEMFKKKFRFEEDLKFANDETEFLYFQGRHKKISESLWIVRRKEIMGEPWDGIEKDEIQDCEKDEVGT